MFFTNIDDERKIRKGDFDVVKMSHKSGSKYVSGIKGRATNRSVDEGKACLRTYKL
jgi:hypothetical protein